MENGWVGFWGGGVMHNPTVCFAFFLLLSEFLHHPVSHHQEPLFRCFFNQHHRTLVKRKNHQIEDIRSPFEPWMSLYVCDTLASRVQTEVFRPSPAVWETLCVTFLVNRHMWEEVEGEQFIKVFFQRNVKIWF